MEPTPDATERRAKILTALRTCKMSEPANVGFGLMVQTLKSSGQSDTLARQTAFEHLANMVEAGELEIAGDSLLVTEKGRQWVERARAKGFGAEN